MECIPVRDFLLDFKWVNPLLDWNFEVGRNTTDLDFEAGKHKFLILTFEMERHTATPSSGSLYKDMEEGKLSSLFAFPCMLAHLFIHQH